MTAPPSPIWVRLAQDTDSITNEKWECVISINSLPDPIHNKVVIGHYVYPRGIFPAIRFIWHNDNYRILTAEEILEIKLVL